MTRFYRFACLIMLLNSPCFASLGTAGQKNSANPVYAATESPAVAGVAPVGNQVPLPIIGDPQAPAFPRRIQVTAMPKAPSPQPFAAPRTVGTFDSVPSDQVEPILKRLNLVREILRRYGRAYDYRIHTVRDLEVILAQLDAAAHRPSAARAKESDSISDEPASAPVSADDEGADATP